MYAVDLFRLATVRAERAIRPAQRLEMFAGFIFVVENRVRQVDSGHETPRCWGKYALCIDGESCQFRLRQADAAHGGSHGW